MTEQDPFTGIDGMSHDGEELRGETHMDVSEEQAEKERHIVESLQTAIDEAGSDHAKSAIQTAIDLTIDLKDEYGEDTVDLLEPMISALNGHDPERGARIAKDVFERYQEQRPSEASDYIFVEFTDEKYAVNTSNVWEEYEIDENTGWVTLRYNDSVVELPPQRIMEIQSAGHEDWVEDYFM